MYHYKLTKDITDSVRFVIGRHIIKRFCFDGDGHKITLAINIATDDYVSDLHENFHRNYIGLFRFCDSCVIENLTVDGYIKVNMKTTAIAQDNYAMIGGIVGLIRCGAIVNCTNRASIYLNCVSEIFQPHAGGIFGQVSVGGIDDGMICTAYIHNCQNYGNIIHNCSSSSDEGSGIGGTLQYSTNWESTIPGNPILSNCRNYGFVSGTEAVGGILGIVKIAAPAAPAAVIAISDCLNVGVVNGNNGMGCGCIIGEVIYFDEWDLGKIVITNCHFDKQMCPHDGIGNVLEYY